MFARSAADRRREPEPETTVREPDLTRAEAHIAWLAGAPYALVTNDECKDPRFISLLVPLY